MRGYLDRVLDEVGKVSAGLILFALILSQSSGTSARVGAGGITLLLVAYWALGGLRWFMRRSRAWPVAASPVVQPSVVPSAGWSASIGKEPASGAIDRASYVLIEQLSGNAPYHFDTEAEALAHVRHEEDDDDPIAWGLVVMGSDPRDNRLIAAGADLRALANAVPDARLKGLDPPR